MPEESTNPKPVQTELALVATAPSTRQIPRASRQLIIVTLMAMTALIVVYLLWRNEVRKRFPQIAAGAYLGEINGLALNARPEPIGLYVERHSGNDDISITLLDSGWEPQKASLVERGVDALDSKWSLPLTISNEKGKLRFIGSPFGEGGYAGSVYDLNTGRRGSWTLKPIVNTGGSQESIGDRDLQKWMQLRGNLVEIETQITQAEARSPELRGEIERLTNLIAEGQSLRTNADKKLRDEWNELKRLRSQLSKKQSELRKARAQFDLSQRVTGMGRLVALSREALEREERWLKVNLQDSTSALTPEQQKELERAKKIADLQKKITLQRAIISKLQTAQEAQNASVD